jgi:hypothetical protein
MTAVQPWVPGPGSGLGSGPDPGLGAVAEAALGQPHAPQPVRLRGTAVRAVVRVERDEHLRRRAAGVGAVADRDLLEVLAALEPWAEHPLAQLAPRARRLLRAAPAGWVAVHDGRVVRVATAPARVDLVVVGDSQWRRGLKRAQRFGPYCSRTLFLSRLPRDPTELLLEAAYYGVGVSTSADASVAPPAPFTPLRSTAASWAFAESAYDQILAQEFSVGGNGTSVEVRPANA